MKLFLYILCIIIVIYLVVIAIKSIIKDIILLSTVNLYELVTDVALQVLKFADFFVLACKLVTKS